MKQKWILTGAAFSLAAALTGCSNIPVLNQLQSSQAQTQTDSMGETKEQTVPAQTTPAPVSYTHLDVYKRQGRRSGDLYGKAPCAFGCGEGCGGKNPRARFQGA